MSPAAAAILSIRLSVAASLRLPVQTNGLGPRGEELIGIIVERPNLASR
jgi:hypothetical protein